MKSIHVLLLILFLVPVGVRAQNHPEPVGGYRNFPLVIGVQFQNFALPFKDWKSNFTHIGFFVGTEVSLNGKHTWVQQFQAGYYLNREMGNGFFVLSQSVYRPAVFNPFYPEVKAGIGWLRVGHPTDAYAFQNGKWKKTAGGKSQLIVPVGVSAGYHFDQAESSVSPFISYQIMPALFYNEVIPLNFYTLIQAGSRVGGLW